MDELLVLALEDPVSAQKQAQALLAGPLGDHARSYALQCLGIALRESGRTGEALVHLRRALRAAVDTLFGDDPFREAFGRTPGAVRGNPCGRRHGAPPMAPCDSSSRSPRSTP